MSAVVGDAVASSAVSATVTCPPTDLCVCTAAGVCCQPAAGTTLVNVQIIPACVAGDKY
jgi:hypothetical protein